LSKKKKAPRGELADAGLGAVSKFHARFVEGFWFEGEPQIS
jgi:hypothetical protein